MPPKPAIAVFACASVGKAGTASVARKVFIIMSLLPVVMVTAETGGVNPFQCYIENFKEVTIAKDV